MKIIGENIHIISTKTCQAIEEKNTDFIINMAKKQLSAVDWIDLNIGPARQKDGTMKWLVETLSTITDIPFSLDTTNLNEMQEGLKTAKKPSSCVINSTNCDKERLEFLTDLAAEHNAYIIGLALSAKGIPKTADERYEFASQIIETATSKDILSSKIFIDPLVLPVNIEQSQVQEVFDAIRLTKEAFDPPVMSIVGLSNISNGAPKEIRPLINRVFAVLAMGCGLSCAIANAYDSELLRINQVVESSMPQKPHDKIILDLYEMMQKYGELEDIKYDTSDEESTKIYKTAEILLNKKIYSHSFLEI